MLRMLYLLYVLLISVSTAIADCPVKQSSPCLSHLEISFKTGYFFFTSEKMRRVYKNGGLDLQFSACYPIHRSFRAYGSFEYLKKLGHSIKGHQSTSFEAFPLSLGLQKIAKIIFFVPIDCYFSVGPRYFITNVKNHSSYVSKHMPSNGFGGFANTGILLRLYSHWNLNLFGEYSYARLHYSSSVKNSQSHTVQAGGLTFGGGLVYVF